ncbi:MAG: M20 family metallopeptidase [Hyphomicrobiales bacterium]|nr:M20 family metallopeptidase [Hyphomicrobiales bacterium]
MLEPIALTRDLIRFRTINPPGDEQPCAEFLGRILEGAGFECRYVPMGENRANLIARIGGSGDKLPLCFSGHTDVVPLGAKPWTVEPFAADVDGDRIYGRGATDMKGGVAAFIKAAVDLAPHLARSPGLVLVISAGEERGCEGANLMARTPGALPQVGAMIVAEPTSNQPLVGHKGVLWVEGRALGVTAHGSMAYMGDNAVYKAARVVTRLEGFKFPGNFHNSGGEPSLSVGWLRGGMNVNSVPDEAKIGLDIRMVQGMDEDAVLAALNETGGGEVEFVKLSSAAPVWSDPTDLWVQSVFDICARTLGERPATAVAPYFTDAAALKPAMGSPPTLIFGPGDPELAHQTDEWASIARIEQASAMYAEIARAWCGL